LHDDAIALPIVPSHRGERPDDTSTGQLFAGTLWKLNTGKDPRSPEEWLQRDMWIADNGSLCYYRMKENKRLVLVNMEHLKSAEIEPLDLAAKDHAMVITCDTRDEDGGKVFVFAANTAEELGQWMAQLREATVNAMPSMQFGVNLAEEIQQMKVHNRRLKIDAEYKQEYKPTFKGMLWKKKADGDRMCENHWFEREVWLSRNGSLVYWSHKEHRELIYYTHADVVGAELKLIPRESTCHPWAFQVCLPASDGVEFAPGEFAAETEEMRDKWICEWKKVASIPLSAPSA